MGSGADWHSPRTRSHATAQAPTLSRLSLTGSLRRSRSRTSPHKLPHSQALSHKPSQAPSLSQDLSQALTSSLTLTHAHTHSHTHSQVRTAYCRSGCESEREREQMTSSLVVLLSCCSCRRCFRFPHASSFFMHAAIHPTRNFHLPFLPFADRTRA
mgnify:CR=1 FL=1